MSDLLKVKIVAKPLA